VFKQFTVFLSATILLFSCACNKIAVPEGVIAPENMTALLIDIQITEAALIEVQQSGRDVDKYQKVFYGYVFEKHNILEKDFELSISFYIRNLELLDKIYADVITGLSEKQILYDNK